MNRIKECRINSKLSQKYVALSLGVASPSVSNWESGKTKPTPDNYKRLAQLFGVSTDYLMGDEKQLLPDEKKPVANSNELDERLVMDLVNLRPDEIQRVRDFVAGIQANRKEEVSPHQ